MKTLTLHIVLFFTLFLASSDKTLSESRVDSLLTVLNNQTDTFRINTMYSLALAYRDVGNSKDSKKYLQKAIKEAHEFNYKDHLTNYFNSLALADVNLGILNDTTFAYVDSAEHYALIDSNYNLMSRAYDTRGILYYSKSITKESLEQFYLALKYREKNGVKLGTGKLWNNIGLIYRKLNDDKSALSAFKKAKQIALAEGDSIGLQKVLNNIGLMYSESDPQKALDYYMTSLAMSERRNDKFSTALRKMNIGSIYTSLGKFETAQKYLLEALELYNDVEARAGMLTTYSSLAHLCIMNNKVTEAKKYLAKAEAFGSTEDLDLQRIYDTKYKIAAAEGDHKAAIELFKMHRSYLDSLRYQQRRAVIAEINAQYNFEKKKSEINLLKKDNQIQELELNQQEASIKNYKLFVILGAASIVLLILVGFMIYSRFKSKNVLTEKLQKKNEAVTNSINYAKRLQAALLPSRFTLLDTFKEVFVLYKPKDIVSGDFYWFSRKGNLTIVAVADCTGHGVPGGLLSMMGNTLLNEIVNQKNITSPKEILVHLNRSIVETLGQKNVNLKTQDDGMDIGILVFDKDSQEVTFAGANHSLTIVSSGKAETIYGDLFGIGGFIKNISKDFSEQKLGPMSPNSMLYMYSDGYFDQFGGPEHKKFMSRRFINLLTEESAKPCDDQKKALEETFNNWKGDEPQIDDVLILGIRV